MQQVAKLLLSGILVVCWVIPGDVCTIVFFQENQQKINSDFDGLHLM